MQNRLEEQYYQEQIDQDNAVELSQYLLDILIGAIEQQEWVPEYRKMDFKDPESVETQDMFVVLNCIAAMLLRFKGYSHIIHDDMNYIREKLLAVQAAYDELDDEWDDE